MKRYKPGDRRQDPFHDFDQKSIMLHGPHPLRFSVGKMDPREVQEYVGHPHKWFKADYLSFYTHWSEMFRSHYDDENEYFSFYTLLVAK